MNDLVRSLLTVDGGLPEAVSVVDVTPDGNATRVYAVRLDYGWCEEIVDAGYLRHANAVAVAFGECLGVAPDLIMDGQTSGSPAGAVGG
jgi:hypothetical protein